MGIGNPQIEENNEYVRGIELQLVLLADEISTASYNNEDQYELYYNNIKKDVDTLQMLCYNVLKTLTTHENKEVIKKINQDTTNLLGKPLPKTNVAFHVFFLEARKLYMAYNDVLIDCQAIKVR